MTKTNKKRSKPRSRTKRRMTGKPTTRRCAGQSIPPSPRKRKRKEEETTKRLPFLLKRNEEGEDDEEESMNEV